MIAPLLAALADGFAVVLVLALLTTMAAATAAYLINPADPFPQPVTCWLQRFLGIPNENQEHEPKAPHQASSVRIQIHDGPIYLDCSLSALLVRQGLLLTSLSDESGSKSPQQMPLYNNRAAMTAHKTTTHHGVRRGKAYSSTWCDICHWTNTTTNKTEAAQAARNHEKDNQ